MNFFKKNKKIFASVFAVIIVTGVFVFLADVETARAIEIWSTIKSGFWSLLLLPLNLARLIGGYMMMWFIKLIVILAKYNNFVDQPYVTIGWKSLRDIVNMFFILGLLFIAFAMVLKIEKYPVNKFMSRLLIMAILVNFSKTICGVVIDFFQVIMLSFVNSFKDIAEGNIFKGLGVTWWFDASENPDASADMGQDSGLMAVFTAVLGVMYVFIAAIVMLIFAVILAFRIVALWILVLLSPLAFFSYAFADLGGQIGSISTKWWGKFLNYCMIGPFLAFFLWLSISTMGQMRAAQFGDAGDFTGGDICDTSEACQFENMFGFFMSIVLLIGGLVASADFGVVGSQWGASKVRGLQGRATAALDSSARFAARGAAGAAMYMPRRGMRAVGAYTKGAATGLMGGLSDRYIHGPRAKDTTIGKGIQMARKAPVIGGVMRQGRAFLRATTEQGATDVQEETEGRFRKKVGPKGLAEEHAREKVSERVKADIEQEAGAIDSQKKYGELLTQAEDTGDYRRHRALLEIGADKGFMQKQDVDDFRERFSGKGKMYSGEDDMSWVRFSQNLEDKYTEQTGEVMPLNKYVLDDEGQLIDRADYDKGGRHQETMEKVKRMTPDQRRRLANNKTTGDIFSARGDEMKETRLSNMFGLAANPGSIGKYGADARAGLQDRIGQILESEEGQSKINQMIDEGKLDKKDVDNLETMYWKLGGKYNEDDGRPLEGSEDVEKIKATAGSGDKKHEEILNRLKGSTKSAVGSKLATDNKVKNVGNIKTDSLDNIRDSFAGKTDEDGNVVNPGVEFDKKQYAFTAIEEPDEEKRNTNKKMNKKIKDAKTESRAIAQAVDINKATKGVDINNEELAKEKIKKAIEETKRDKTGNPAAATEQEVDKAWRDAKRGEFTQGSIRKKALAFQANYGSVEDKTQSVKLTIESEAHDDTIGDFGTAIDKFESPDMDFDIGDLETAAEEAIISTETMQNKTESAGKQLNIEVDAQFKKDKTKLTQTAKRFRSEKDGEKKKDIAKEMLKHFMETQAKFKEGSSSKGYFKGEYQKDRIANELDKVTNQASLKFNSTFMAGVKKAMKEDIKDSSGQKVQGSYENIDHIKKAIEATLKKQNRR